MCAALRTFATDRVTYIFAKQNRPVERTVMDTKQQLVNALVGLGLTITEAMDVIEGFVPLRTSRPHGIERTRRAGR